MAGKPYDVTLKDLIESDSISWARRFSRQTVKKATLLDADVSTLSAAADKVLRVEGDRGTCLMNIEAEARHAADAPERLHFYSTVLRRRHDLPVRSILLLLRREANATNLTGRLEIADPEEDEPYLIFRYHVVRLWHQPLEPLLSGGLGQLPLAPLTDEAGANLSGVLRRIDERYRQETTPDLADKMRSATFLLMGLRYDQVFTEQLLQEISKMDPLWEESSVYKMFFSRGRVQEARAILLRLGRPKLGEPDSSTLTNLEGIASPERLENLIDRVNQASSWQDLLATA